MFVCVCVFYNLLLADYIAKILFIFLQVSHKKHRQHIEIENSDPNLE